MRIRISKDASAFLRNEQRYLEQFNPRAAETVLTQIRAALRLLAEYPHAGSPHAALPDRRRFVSGNYVIDYRLDGRFLLVSHIRHGQQLPPELERDGDLDAAD
jgi:plasmid stabilization system protein ParE